MTRLSKSANISHSRQLSIVAAISIFFAANPTYCRAEDFDLAFVPDTFEIEVARHREKYHRLKLSNQTNRVIWVALHYMNEHNTWPTRGWWKVNPGSEVLTDALLKSSHFCYYAYSEDRRMEWRAPSTQKRGFYFQVNKAGKSYPFALAEVTTKGSSEIKLPFREGTVLTNNR